MAHEHITCAWSRYAWRMRQCCESGCERPHLARGMCARHYRRWYLQQAEPCSVPGCSGKAWAKGLCNTHYARLRTRGDISPEVLVGDLGPKGPKGHGRTPQAIARNLVQHALETGRLERPERCARCGRKMKRLEAHHTDYSRPLEVEWLCVSCHRNHHVVWLPAEVADRLDAVAATRGLTRNEALLWMLEVVDG